MRAIYAQFLIEAGIVGVAGGVLGLRADRRLGVASVGWVLPRDIAELARLDVSLLLLTLLVAVVATVLAGLLSHLARRAGAARLAAEVATEDRTDDPASHPRRTCASTRPARC